MAGNRLYYGDNLSIMERMPLQSVDLIYLDPPFNSKRNYNLMYTDMTGRTAPDQDIAFCDTWEMDAEKEELARNIPAIMHEYDMPHDYVECWRLWFQALRNTNPKLLAYLLYMTRRLLHMKVILKPTGSLYLHCDPTASHYIKALLDAIFGHDNFRNEIIWKRTSAHSDSGTMGAVHDILLYYTKSNRFTFNTQYGPYDKDYVDQHYRHKDPDGRRFMDDNLTAKGLSGGGYDYEYKGKHSSWRVPKETMEDLDADGRLYFTRRGGIRIKRYLNEMKGLPISDVWTDIFPINSQAKERLGYPTQKPIALLRRIVEQSSNPGDVVFDPFCGCGTSIYAAHGLKREWIGCDIAILAVELMVSLLNEKHALKGEEHYELAGIPVTWEQADKLFKQDPFEFERWVVQYMDGIPTKKTGDRGIDGRVYLQDGTHIVLSVKGGTMRPTDVRDLRGVLEREADAKGACLLSLREPSKKMREEAAVAGTYDYNGQTHPRLKLLTIKDIMSSQRIRSSSNLRRSRIKSGQYELPL